MKTTLIAALIAALCLVAWWQGGAGTREAEAKIETLERIGDANDDCPDQPDWLERLRCAGLD